MSFFCLTGSSEIEEEDEEEGEEREEEEGEEDDDKGDDEGDEGEEERRGGAEADPAAAVVVVVVVTVLRTTTFEDRLCSLSFDFSDKTREEEDDDDKEEEEEGVNVELIFSVEVESVAFSIEDAIILFKGVADAAFDVCSPEGVFKGVETGDISAAAAEKEEDAEFNEIVRLAGCGVVFVLMFVFEFIFEFELEFEFEFEPETEAEATEVKVEMILFFVAAPFCVACDVLAESAVLFLRRNPDCFAFKPELVVDSLAG